MNTELLREAYAIIDGIPAENINLFDITTKMSRDLCGTVACAAGWLALHPEFRKKTGLSISKNGSLLRRGVYDTYDTTLSRVFSCAPAEARQLFGPRVGFMYDEYPITDKEVWQRRVRYYLKNGKAKE